MRFANALLVCLALLLGQCAPWQQISANADDFAQYREVRIAQGLPARLQASWAYLRDFPEGSYRGEVRRWFDRAGGSYLQRWWNDEARLLAYLGWVPDGPHAPLIEQRLQALARQTVQKREYERRLVAAARGRETEFQRAAASRQELLVTFKRWLSHLAAVRSFGQPTSFLSHDFLHDFRELEPRASCSAQRCHKLLILPYAVVDKKKLSWRELLLEIELGLDGGAVARASIKGVGLFAAVAEALQKRTAHSLDLQAQAEALGAMIQLTALTLATYFQEAACEQPATSPQVLVRECQGVRLEARAGLRDDESDQVLIAPSLAGAPAPSSTAVP